MSNMAVDVFARTLALASLGNGGEGSAVDTYTKAEIDRMFGEAGTVQVEAVDVLPTENIKENVIYLVPNGSSGENFYDECMYINNKWETIGTTEIDLSNYATKDELEEALVDMVTVDVLNAYATKEQLDKAVIQPATIINTDASDKIKMSSTTTRTQVVEYFNKILTELNYDVLSPNNVIKSVVGPVDKFPISLSIDGFLHPVLGISFKHYANNKVTVAFYIGDYITSHSVRTENLQYSSVATFARYMFYLTEAEVKAKNIQTIYNIDGKANGDIPISAGSVKYIYNQPYNFIPTDNTTSYTPVGDYNPATKKYVDDSVAAIEIPSLDGLATEEYVNNQIAAVSGNGINCYNINTRLYQYTDGGPSSTQITDAEDIAVLETIINTQVPNTEIFLINNTDAHNESTYLATMTYKERNYCEINISSTLLWLGSVTGNLQIDYEEVDGQLKITNAIAGVYEFGYELAANYYNKDEVADQLEAKQDTLTAGEGISIINNVISATSSGESSATVFEGTQEEYDALSDEEKAKYTIVVIDDGEGV